MQLATPPYPPAVGGVSVAINNIPAPIYYVSDTQLNILVPYAAQGTTARIVVNNNGKTSNAVDVPLAKTSPGGFSLDVTGTGPGAILHADFTLVNAASPAKKGETVLVFLTGLGGTSPAVADGTAGGSNLSRSGGCGGAIEVRAAYCPEMGMALILHFVFYRR